MKVEPNDLKVFQRLWKEQFGETISNEEALEKAISLLGMMQVIYKPLPKLQPLNVSPQLSILDFNKDSI